MSIDGANNRGGGWSCFFCCCGGTPHTDEENQGIYQRHQNYSEDHDPVNTQRDGWDSSDDDQMSCISEDPHTPSKDLKARSKVPYDHNAHIVYNSPTTRKEEDGSPGEDLINFATPQGERTSGDIVQGVPIEKPEKPTKRAVTFEDE